MKNQPYNPDDKSIWYNNPDLKKKIETITEDFGQPFIITKTGELLYEHCVVIPSFRNSSEEYDSE